MSEFKVGDIVYISDRGIDMSLITKDLCFSREEHLLKFINKKAKISGTCGECSRFDYSITLLDNDKVSGSNNCLMKSKYINKISHKSKILKKI